jgi:organic hydroperoxide reductase OsmC/OhrA
MQKEALVFQASPGTTWRLVSDEGPYLNGTDLAPFPLAFFTTGMALSFTEALLRSAAAAGVKLTDYCLTQDNYYTMAGSAIRGDMIGGALPVQMRLEIESKADDELMRQLVTRAHQNSPAHAYLSQALANRFALFHNGQPLPAAGLNPAPDDAAADPTPQLEATKPLNDDDRANAIIVKLQAAEALYGVEGGAGSSLQATQKRTLHVRGICRLRPDGLKEVEVRLIKPLGSTFCFLGDDTGRERAPSSLSYLAAGIGFCFMTQIGRYAQIVKHNLKSYSIVQDTCFHMTASGAAADPVDTYLFLQMDETAEAAQQTLAMSERTCFLHAAMRDQHQTQFLVELNGREIAS